MESYLQNDLAWPLSFRNFHHIYVVLCQANCTPHRAWCNRRISTIAINNRKTSTNYDSRPILFRVFDFYNRYSSVIPTFFSARLSVRFLQRRYYFGDNFSVSGTWNLCTSSWNGHWCTVASINPNPNGHIAR